MRAVVSLHTPFGLRRIRCNDADSQLRAHTPKLRHRHLSTQFLPGRRFRDVHVLPVRIQRLGNAILTHPFPQHCHRCPDRLFLAEDRLRPAGRIIHHVHQKAFRSALLKPGVLAAIKLHQFPKVRPSFPSLPVGPVLPLPAPQPRLQHPATQRLRMHLQAVITAQVLSRQSRTKSLPHFPAVLLSNQRHRSLTQLPCFAPVRTPSSTAVHQPLRALLPVSFPDTLCLPIAHLHQRRRIPQSNLSPADAAHHFVPLQLPHTHPCPSQPEPSANLG